MPVEIGPASATDIAHVALAMRDSDFRELRALSWAADRHELVDLLVEQYRLREDIVCVRRDNEPVVIGGFIEMRPRVISLMMFATDGWSKVWRPATRFVTDTLHALIANGAHRIEAVSTVGHDDSHRWLRRLGLTEEGPPLLRYGRDGEDFQNFVRLPDARPPGA